MDERPPTPWAVLFDELIAEGCTAIAVAVTLVGMGAPLLDVGWRAYCWLKFGVAPSLQVKVAAEDVGVRMPTVDWIGLQKIIEWVFDLPLSIAVFLVAVILVPLLLYVRNMVPAESIRDAKEWRENNSKQRLKEFGTAQEAYERRQREAQTAPLGPWGTMVSKYVTALLVGLAIMLGLSILGIIARNFL
ncbi:MAG: hypothetical protein ABSE20_08505 [Acetobacteraceae bacterium]|jgi:hypothetical protein